MMEYWNIPETLKEVNSFPENTKENGAGKKNKFKTKISETIFASGIQQLLLIRHTNSIQNVIEQLQN